MNHGQFPNIQQEVGSSTCGPNCLLNIYTYYNIKTNLEKILKELSITKKSFTYLPQLAQHLQKNNLKTLILNSNPREVVGEWINRSTKKIVQELKKWIAHHKKEKRILIKDIGFLISYLKNGGSQKIVDLTTEMIDEYLDKGYLIISCLNEAWIWEKRKMYGVAKFDNIKGRTAGHFVVVYGKEKNNYLISDPYPTGLKGRDGLYPVNKNKLLVSTLVWGAQVLALKKY